MPKSRSRMQSVTSGDSKVISGRAESDPQESSGSGGQNLPAYIPSSSEQFSFLLGEDFVEKHNVAWRVELAKEETSNPLMEPKFPWESAAVFSHGTVMVDPIDGLWKAWYVSCQQTKLQS